MTNKRSIKKAIKATCGDIAGECLMARAIMHGIDKDKIEEAIIAAADLQFTSLAAVSFSFDKVRSAFDNTRAYRQARRRYFRQGFAKLRSDFVKGFDAVVDKMNAALPVPEQKPAAE